jgi:hypothetical protein
MVEAFPAGSALWSAALLRRHPGPRVRDSLLIKSAAIAFLPEDEFRT